MKDFSKATHHQVIDHHDLPEHLQVLSEEVKQHYDNAVVIKSGPTQYPLHEQTNIILHDPSNQTYIKAYAGTHGKKRGTSEIQSIQQFNNLSLSNNIPILGPSIKDIVSTITGNIVLVMEDISKDGFESVLFPEESLDKLFELYNHYRQSFQEFSSLQIITTEKSPKLQMMIKQLYTLEEKLKQIKIRIKFFRKQITALVKNTQYKQIESYINKSIISSDVVDNSLKEEIKQTYQKLQKKVGSFDLEYVYGRFRTGHVYWNKDQRAMKILDFDNLGYQLPLMEILGVMRSNALLPIEKYNSYESWEQDVQKWKDKLDTLDVDSDLVTLQLAHKLIGTVFADFGTIKQRDVQSYQQELDQKGYKDISAQETINKGIMRNLMFLKKLL